MKPFRNIRKLLLACSVVLTTTVLAAPLQIELPAETAQLRVSTLPGYAIATQRCATCHSADYINYQPPAMSQVQWTNEAAKMQHSYGAQITDDEVKKIGAYLAVAYGNAKVTDPAISVASGMPSDQQMTSSIATGSASNGLAIDTKALLTSNACLGCHSIDKKIVGPAYHDVAVKYKNDAEALVKIETSIRQGGAGKWGQIPMPAYAGLSAEQVHALAKFILAQ